jgi:hypothetical protein
MQGATYAAMAKNYLRLSGNAPPTNRRSSGSQPIPAILGFLRKVVDPLAIDAGCFVAINELGVNEEEDSLPDVIQGLPLCIRNGCDSLGTLSWYRFGYRERVCAHALQRAFPVPDDLSGDSARAEWIRQTREGWLAGGIPTEDPLLEHARIVIEKGSDQ